jgi:hypothetical protein
MIFGLEAKGDIYDKGYSFVETVVINEKEIVTFLPKTCL